MQTFWARIVAPFTLKLLIVLCCILLPALLFFVQTPTSTMIDNARLSSSDSQTLFWFQCPIVSWDVAGVRTVQLNRQNYPATHTESICADEYRLRVGFSDFLTLEHITIIDSPEALAITALLLFILIQLVLTSQMQQWDTLAIFTLLWGGAYFFHLAGYDTGREFWVLTLLPLSMACLAIIRPQVSSSLLLLALAQVIEYSLRPPMRSNHTLIMTIINIVIITVFLWKRTDRQQVYETFAPVIRFAVPIIYFWAAFHKLNSAFFDPNVSCVAVFYQRMTETYSFLPSDLIITQSGIIITIVLELALPILFLYRRTRFVAILIGIVFHAVLALDNFRDFSALMFALYFAYLPYQHMNMTWLAQQYHRYSVVFNAALAIMLTLVVTTVSGIRQAELGTQEIIYLFIAYAGVMLFLYLKHAPYEFPRLGTSTNPLLWIVIPLLILNGLAPYLGYKTDNSFEMYSNLRVEAESNHLLIPAYTQLWNYPHDLVQIIRSDSAELNLYRTEGYLLPFTEFRRIVYELDPTYVEYQRGDNVYQLDADNRVTLLGTEASFLFSKIFIFAPVAIEKPTPCGF